MTTKRRRRLAEAPPFRAWSWRIVAATALLLWGVMTIGFAGGAKAATSGSGSTPVPQHPKPAKPATKQAPKPSHGTGFSAPNFAASHTEPANPAGLLKSAPKALAPTSGTSVEVGDTTDNTPADATANAATECADPTTCTLRDAVTLDASPSTIDAATILVDPGLYQIAYGPLPDLSNAQGLLIEANPNSTPPGTAANTVISYAAGTVSPSYTYAPTSLKSKEGVFSNGSGGAPAGPSGTVSEPVVQITDGTGSPAGWPNTWNDSPPAQAAGNTARYYISFTTSVTGALPGASTITLVAPPGTVLPPQGSGNYIVYDVTDPLYCIQTGAVTRSTDANGDAIATITVDAPTFGPCGDGININETPPGQALVLEVNGVTNPSSGTSLNNETLSVYTSADNANAPTGTTSAPYSIVPAPANPPTSPPTGEVYDVSANVSNHPVGATGVDYTVQFTPQTSLSGGATQASSDTITISAPTGTVFTSTNPWDYLGCSGSGCQPSNTYFQSVSVNAAGNQVTLTLSGTGPCAYGGTSGTPCTAPAGQPVTIIATHDDSPAYNNYDGTYYADNDCTQDGGTPQSDGTCSGNVEASPGSPETNPDNTTNVTNPPTPSVADELQVWTNTAAGGGDTTPTWSNAYVIGPVSGGSVFAIGTTSGQGSTEIDNLSIEGGARYDGGGVHQPRGAGSVQLDNDTLLDNNAYNGGGAYLDGVAYLSGDSFLSNLAEEEGGGLYAYDYSDVLTSNVTAEYNGSYDGGGARFDGTLNSSNLVADYNLAFDDGGGVYLNTYNDVLSGVTANHNGGLSEGGGIYEGSATSTLTDVVADYDVTYGSGGGLADEAGNFTLDSSSGSPANDFSYDSASCSDDCAYGGGMYLDGGADTLSNVTANNDSALCTYDCYGGGIYDDVSNQGTWTNVTADHDTAQASSSYSAGGGVYAEQSTFHWTNGSASNDSAIYGGGIDNDAVATLDSVTVDHDIATDNDGGGIANDYSLTMNNGDVSYDQSLNDDSGGGIYDGDSGVNLTDTTVTNDYASDEGGGIYEDGGGLSMTGGSLSNDTAEYDGGGLSDDVGSTLSNVPVNNDTVNDGEGGGIYEDNGILAMTGGSLSNDTSNDSSGGYGGGLTNYDVATLSGVTLDTDVAQGMTGSNAGGAVANDYLLTLVNDTISNSSADFGGGIENDDDSALSMTGSTLTGNTATTGGGGIYNNDSPGDGDSPDADTVATLTNDTLNANSVGNGSGGGISNAGGVVNLTEVTSSANSATSGAGGIDNESGGTVNVAYSILSGDTVAGTQLECYGAPLTSGGYNVEGDNSCGLQAATDQVNTDPQLQPLANNGGPTETMAIPSTSPAVNVQVSNTCPTNSDQRGMPRPTSVNGVTGCDAGAYQVQAATDTLVFTTQPPSSVNTGTSFPVVVKVEDGNGNVVTTDNTDQVTLSLNPSSGGLNCTTNPVTVSSGVATFSCSVTTAGTGYTLTATSTGLKSATSNAFNVTTPSNNGGGGGGGGGGGNVVTPPVTTNNNGGSGGSGGTGGNGGTKAPTVAQGFWLLGGDGGVFTFGAAGFDGAGKASTAPAVAIVPTPSGGGYWIVSSDGTMRNFGNAPALALTGLPGHSSLAGVKLAAPIVGAAATPDGKGMWMVGSDGGVFTFGDAQTEQLAGAPGHISLAGIKLGGPIVGIAATPTGHGFWLLGSDGGVYTFGDAPFEGAGRPSSARAVAIVATNNGLGYWIVDSDGVIGNHGNAPALALTGDPGHSSLAGITLASPIVGAAKTIDGGGLWLTGSDGGVFTFGDAPLEQLAGAPGHISLGGIHLASPIISIGRS